ncbi:UNVERIFIED_CONTAM: hypothetical protein PYX00_010107 [Menopon gallinae]|uniref:E3 ubiquitin-protein ligase n=1 Tax=Menopon gallinae TaxID=328185 RepID=A0AAW2HE27_9NEOP
MDKMKSSQINLMKKIKRSTIATIKSSSDSLRDFLNELLAPVKDINDPETIEWCRWLMAGGLTPEEFANEVKQYDNATTCGLVWTANFVAYRCRTCGISPCMSLCAECFQRGNHEGHDFNMFRSQAGGACDCGDTYVMKESGFCGRHGPQAQAEKPNAPDDLMCLPNAIMPRLIFRLIQHMRENCNSPATVTADADAFLNMFHDFSAMGTAMRRVMTRAITDPQVYKDLTEWSHPSADPELSDTMLSTTQSYQHALKSLLNPEPPEELKDCPSLQEQLVHKTFLEELMFWTVKFEFPQKVVCLLLNMLPDPDYKEPLTRAFVLHYSRIPMMLERSRSPDTLSNRVVHVSVQLFSNESLALKMTTELNLLHVMVVSLKYMMSKILIPNTLHDPEKNFHEVVDCGQQVMKEHCYWPLVSDLNNVLSHRPVAFKFMSDDNLLDMWFVFLSMFQGMNVNQRELCQHVEFEPTTYYAAFSAELEASAYPMWSLVSHLKDESTLHLTKNVLKGCIAALQEWFDAINFTQPVMNDYTQISFHLPLHRYLAVLISQAVKCQGVSLKEILPPPDVLNLAYQHPLMLQVAFYEILNGMWVRNGVQIRGQMMTYIQCNFCNSMVDADLYLLQICATQIEPEKFLSSVIEMFRVTDALSIAPYKNPTTACFEYEFEPAMLESCLTFLATLIDMRANLGVSEAWVSKLEIVTLLCMGDKTHSQLIELMPERSGTGHIRDFDIMLSEVADYRAPSNMQQGMYAPKPQVWEELYDPIHVLLRAVQKRDFQTSIDRFTEYVQQTKKLKPGSGNVWPPFKPPAPCGDPYEDPSKLLQSRIFHAIIFCVLYKAVDRRNVSEHVLALAIYLLEIAILSSPPCCESELCQTECCDRYDVTDTDLTSFYEQDWLSHNLRTVIHSLVFMHEPENNSDCIEMESELDSNDNSHENTEGAVVPGSHFRALVLTPEGEESNTVRSLPVPPIDLPSTSQESNSQLVPVNPSTSAITPRDTGNEVVPVTRPRSLECKKYNKLKRSKALEMEVSQNASGQLASSTSQSSMGKDKGKYGADGGLVTHVSMQVNESIISLLLKLHAQLSGTPDSYVPGQQTAEGLLDSRIGDGPFFIAKVLDRIASLDERCRDYIKETKEALWPKRAEEDGMETKAREAKEREERRRRAKERQQKLIEEFASKQKQFMEKAMETEENCECMEWNDENAAQIKSEYDCVICNQTTPSTQEKPMGLVVLVQASSVLGHKRKSNTEEVLPTSDEEKKVLLREDSLASDFDKRVEELNREFDANSWLLSINVGWDNGVHVQTCGHHLHMDCLKAYLQSLSQQRQQALAVDRGEYACPLCRRLANSVLPLVPELGEVSSVSRSRPLNLANQIGTITNLLKNCVYAPRSSNLTEAMDKSMEDIMNCTYMRFKHKIDSPSPYRFLLFVSSIARTNLEIEIVQKGGSFLTKSNESALIPKRSCIVPLLHVLAIHGRIINQWPIWQTWQQLSELPLEEAETQIANIQKEVPLLLRDPVALLIQFLLFLPLNLDQSYFSCIVKCLYNLLYFQVLSQISVNMTESERESWRDPTTESSSDIKSVDAGLRFVINQLASSSLYVDSGNSSTTSEGNSYSNKQAIEAKVQSLCLPYLRIASLLRHHLFNEEIPEIRSEETEFVRLVYYLELVSEGMNWSKFNAAVALCFPKPGLQAPRTWFRELSTYIERSQRAARNFLTKLHLLWYPPRLLKLPQNYDRIFQYYHKRQCNHCHSVPREASVCLLCGTLVCFKETCCKNGSIFETVQHSFDCGAGTGMFLVVTSSYVIVIRGKRACVWGSVYLDSFGEEDRELKRGKPLFLCPERYQLLEEQWITHRFEHTNKKWVWHRDAL